MATVLCDACWKANDAAATVCGSCGRPLVPAVLDWRKVRITRTRTYRLTCFVLLQPLAAATYAATIALAWPRDYPLTSLGGVVTFIPDTTLTLGFFELIALHGVLTSISAALLVLLLVHLVLSWGAIVLVERAGRAIQVSARRRLSSRAGGAWTTGRWLVGVLATTLASLVVLLFAEAVVAYAVAYLLVLGPRPLLS